jgi:hypothetical protein
VGYPKRVSGELVKLLDLPKGVLPFVLLCIGYPDESPPVRFRLPISAIIHENGYKLPSTELLRKYFEDNYGSLDRAHGSWGFNFPKEATEFRENKIKKDFKSAGFLY